MNKDKIVKEFHLKRFGSKEWMRGDLCCPSCGKSDKFGVLFVDNSGVTRCFYCSQSIPLWKILKDIGRSDLLDWEFEYTGKISLAPLKKVNDKEEEKAVDLPIGFVRTTNSPYLWNRGFTPEQFEQFKVGAAPLDPRTEDKVVFLIYQQGKLAGWMARSEHSKEWHHENLRRHKQFNDPLVLRYRNSNNDFAKMLGGIDEVTENTSTLILVEGLFDKANLDRLMGLNDAEDIKCCYTFGSDLSVEQVALIPKTVDQVILMYDKGTIHSMREAGGRLMSLFMVKVALIEDESVDPGCMCKKYLSRLLSNLKEFIYFYTSLQN